MLAYILAVLVGTGSVGLYISAFFFPEIHRKHDFIWSGVGFFYALVLWIYAGQETGGILVGQTASVALLGWFAWQTLKLRRQLVPVSQQTPIPDTTKLQAQLGLNRLAPKTAKPPSKPSAKPTAPLPKSSIVRPSVRQEAAPGESQISQQPPPPTIPTPTAEDIGAEAAGEEAAWIVLEVKPSSSPSRPLGTAVKPPTILNPEPSPASEIVPENIAPNVPTDPIPTKSQLDIEHSG
jgi:Ycf66 protein N-terminus